MKILRSKDYHRMPWKNGGGITSEIATFPEGSDISEFGWRMSMALVASNGPFSIFPEIDRSLSILDGDGLWLTFEEQEPILLNQTCKPLTFPADVSTSAILVGGDVTDLNVMTRRGVFTHRVQLLDCHEMLQIKLTAEIGMIFCAKGAFKIASTTHTAKLEKYDCSLFLKPNAETFSLEGSGHLYLIEINHTQPHPPVRLREIA